MIRNLTRNTVLVERLVLADTFFKKLVGLMFSFPRDEGLLFVYRREQIVSLHMFFVFYSIDVVWLDSSERVVYLKERFLPFTVVVPPVKARYVLELPQGTIHRSGTRIGDKLEFPIQRRSS